MYSQYCKHLDGNLSFLKTQLFLIKSVVVIVIIIITGPSGKKGQHLEKSNLNTIYGAITELL